MLIAGIPLWAWIAALCLLLVIVRLWSSDWKFHRDVERALTAKLTARASDVWIKMRAYKIDAGPGEQVVTLGNIEGPVSVVELHGADCEKFDEGDEVLVMLRKVAHAECPT